jgi:hypothetical protein
MSGIDDNVLIMSKNVKSRGNTGASSGDSLCTLFFVAIAACWNVEIA